MMADNLESDTGVGFKRRVSDLFDTQLELRNIESPHVAPLSPSQQSPGIASAPAEETVTVRHGSDCHLESFNCLQKKAKCSSDQENHETDQCDLVLLVEGVKEKQGIAEDKYEDVAMKLNDEKFDVVRASSSLLHSPLVDENDSRFSGTEESGKADRNPRTRLSVEEVQMDSAVEDCDNRLTESDRFLGKKKELFSSVDRLESISDSKSHIANLTGESVVVIGGKHSNGVHKMAHSENQRPRAENVKCALKIQVIDDTAVIGSVSRVSKHMEKNVNKKNKHQETFSKEKKPRRRGKSLKKCSVTTGDEMRIFTQIVDSQRGCEIKPVAEEERKKWSYSRKEMEALRFVNAEEQKKKWVAIYCGFGPDVTKEYEGLVVDFKVDFNPQKNIRVNFDPRPLLRKKDSAPPILSWVAAKERANHLKTYVRRGIA